MFLNSFHQTYVILGTYCEIDLAVCNSTGELLCKNGGECIEGPGVSFSCNCSPGNTYNILSTYIFLLRYYLCILLILNNIPSKLILFC